MKAINSTCVNRFISFKKKDEWNASSTVLLFSTSPSSYVKVFMLNAVATAASYPKQILVQFIYKTIFLHLLFLRWSLSHMGWYVYMDVFQFHSRIIYM